MSGMNFDLTDEETEALLKELDHLIYGDRYQFSGEALSGGKAAQSARTRRPLAQGYKHL
jgi:hypothetical protein